MGKFSVNSIRGNEDGKGLKHIGPVKGERKLKLGAGLLSEASKSIVKMEIANLEREQIKKNPNNNYSINDIDSLAESIKNYGIASPLNVTKLEDGTYMLLGGERRITAIDKLIEDPNVPEWNEDTLIPCVIKNLGEIDLPLSDEVKEQYALITTNKEARKYTDADRYIEVVSWEKIIEELRKNGVDTIKMEDKDLKIKGEKTRGILSKVTGMSEGQIQKFAKVKSDATSSLIDSVLDNTVSINVAEKATKILNPKEQDKLAEASKKEKILPEDIEKFRGEETREEYTEKINSDIDELREKITNRKVYFTKKEEKEYNKLIKKLSNVLGDKSVT